MQISVSNLVLRLPRWESCHDRNLTACGTTSTVVIVRVIRWFLQYRAQGVVVYAEVVQHLELCDSLRLQAVEEQHQVLLWQEGAPSCSPQGIFLPSQLTIHLSKMPKRQPEMIPGSRLRPRIHRLNL